MTSYLSTETFISVTFLSIFLYLLAKIFIEAFVLRKAGKVTNNVNLRAEYMNKSLWLGVLCDLISFLIVLFTRKIMFSETIYRNSFEILVLPKICVMILSIVFSFTLNRFVVLRKAELTEKQKNLISVAVSVLTAPCVLLFPIVYFIGL